MPRETRHATIIAYTSACLRKIELSASQVLEETINIRCNDNDKLRLYNLWIWSEQYKVPLLFVVSELLKFWLSKFSSKRRRGTLGVRITTLTSKGSKKYLVSRIQELYPQNEHLTQWNEEREKVLVNMQVTEFSCTDVSDIANQYTQFIEEQRDAIQNSKQKYKRPFRNNPFVQ